MSTCTTLFGGLLYLHGVAGPVVFDLKFQKIVDGFDGLNTARYDAHLRAAVHLLEPVFDLAIDRFITLTVPIGLQTARFMRRGANPGADVVARLKPNITRQQAETELNLIAAQLEQQYPITNKNRRVRMIPLHERFVGDVRQSLFILTGAVGLVLLIGCANVANLLLVCASGRQKEMAVRVALGASRATIIRQWLSESTLLTVLGAGIGILFAYSGTSLIAAQLPDGIPRLREVQFDAPVLLFTLVVSLLTGLLFGLAPALQASRPDLSTGLKEGERGCSGGRQRLRNVLVVGEIALTLALLVGAGLLIQSFRRLLRVDPGFKAQNLLSMQTSVNIPDGQRAANIFEQMQQNLHNLPRVSSVAVSNGMPFNMANYPGFLIDDGSQRERKAFGLRYMVSHDCSRKMGIELLRGRIFTPEDTRETQPVVIINDVLGRMFFPDEEPLGKRINKIRPIRRAWRSWESSHISSCRTPNNHARKSTMPYLGVFRVCTNQIL